MRKTLRANIMQGSYEGGHMLYLNHPAMDRMTDDLRGFYEGATH